MDTETPTTQDLIAGHEAALKALRKIAEDERNVRLDSVKPVYDYVLVTVTEQERWRKIMDPAVILVRLEGVVTNTAELRKAGHSERAWTGGGMTYYFNTATGRFICDVGGGTTYRVTPAGFEALAEWYLAHPKGGSVTAIVEAHRDTTSPW